MSRLPEELVAYSYLPFDAEVAGVSAVDILTRTYAIAEREVEAPAELAGRVADAVLAAGATFLDATNAPDWLAGATYRTGLSFFLALRFQQARTRLGEPGWPHAPETVIGWLDYLFAVLKVMPPDRIREMLGRPLNAQPVRVLWSDDFQGDDPAWNPPDAWESAWDRLAAATVRYVEGDQLTALAPILLGVDDELDQERSTGDKPLPRMVSFTNVTIERLSRLAGLLVACEELDPRVLPVDSPRDESDARWFSLAVLPLAIRCGCGDLSSLAWFRFGVPFRRPAHLLGSAFPLPPEAWADSQAREWVGARRGAWLNAEADAQVEGNEELLSAVKITLGAVPT